MLSSEVGNLPGWLWRCWDVPLFASIKIRGAPQKVPPPRDGWYSVLSLQCKLVWPPSTQSNGGSKCFWPLSLLDALKVFDPVREAWKPHFAICTASFLLPHSTPLPPLPPLYQPPPTLIPPWPPLSFHPNAPNAIPAQSFSASTDQGNQHTLRIRGISSV